MTIPATPIYTDARADEDIAKVTAFYLTCDCRRCQHQLDRFPDAGPVRLCPRCRALARTVAAQTGESALPGWMLARELVAAASVITTFDKRHYQNQLGP